ncbi:MAG: glycosyltransferase [Paludibacter sp.]|nr:glycosyltransferase [Paludibacter sp.]
MNEKIIRLSILIPCYNAEKYIGECLDSLYNQDIPESEYEIICVNDCSSDGTRNIIVKYQNKHKNLILIDNKENKGQAETRNVALKASKGEFIWFNDDDDFVEKNCFKMLLNIVENENLDILKFGVQRYKTENGKVELTPFNTYCYSDEKEIVSGPEYLATQKNGFADSVWNKIFRRKLLIDNEIYFPDMPYYEDIIFSLESNFHSERIKNLFQDLYYYRTNLESQINKPFSTINYYCQITLCAYLLNFSKQIKDKFPELAKLIKDDTLEYNLDFSMKEIPYFNFAQRKKIVTALLPHLPEIIESNYFSGIKKFYFVHFNLANGFLYALSPCFIFFRKLNIFFKKFVKQTKKVVKRIIKR